MLKPWRACSYVVFEDGKRGLVRSGVYAAQADAVEKTYTMPVSRVKPVVDSEGARAVE